MKTGGWPRRLVRHHVPLALASAAILLLWMSLPLFAPADRRPPQEAHQAAQTAPHGSPAQAAGHQTSPQARAHQASPQPQGGDHQATPAAAGPTDRLVMARLTTATGYLATGLLALTLLIGPAKLLLRKRNPVSSYLRRDVGMWTAAASVVHVIVGLQVHGPLGPLGDRILGYFVGPDGPLTDAFGLGNWTGLGATVIVLGLLAMSSDAALRTFKAGPWKQLQRLNYVLFALVVAHAIYYGALLRVTSPATIVLGAGATLVAAGQLMGIWIWRRRSRAAVAAGA